MIRPSSSDWMKRRLIFVILPRLPMFKTSRWLFLPHSWPRLIAILGLLWLRGGACARFSSGAMDPGQSLIDGSRRLS